MNDKYSSEELQQMILDLIESLSQKNIFLVTNEQISFMIGLPEGRINAHLTLLLKASKIYRNEEIYTKSLRGSKVYYNMHISKAPEGWVYEDTGNGKDQYKRDSA